MRTNALHHFRTVRGNSINFARINCLNYDQVKHASHLSGQLDIRLSLELQRVCIIFMNVASIE